MTTARDIAGYAWEGMTLLQRVVVVGAVLLIAGALIFLTVKYFGTSIEIKRLEWKVSRAERDADAALKRAADIAKEKLEVERKLADLETARNAKEREANEAHIKTLDARSDYVRALRERRGDDPGTDQLCLELAALGYPCS